MNAQSTKAKSMSEAEAILEKSGFSPVSCDEQGIHFLARKPISVQHRTRLGVYKRNVGRDLHMCFPVNKDQDPPRWYLVPHDKLAKNHRKAQDAATVSGFAGYKVMESVRRVSHS